MNSKRRKPKTPPKAPNKFSWTKLLSIAGVASLIIGFIFYGKDTYEWIRSFSTTKEDSWKQQNYISGINIPLNITSSFPYLNIKTGGITQRVPISLIRNGYTHTNTTPLIITPGGCTPFNLKLLLKNSNLYASTTFKDIDGKYVGKMDFDHWEARNIQIANFYNHDGIMELMDTYQHVLFSMKYIQPNTIDIRGYFFTDSCIQVCNETTQGMPTPLNSESKKVVDKLISEIKPIHTY